MYNNGTIGRGDLIRAIRQIMADQKIDLNAIVREAVSTAVERRVSEVAVHSVIESKAIKEATKLIINDGWKIQQEVARKVASRLSFKLGED